MRDTALASSNIFSAVTSVDHVGGLQPTRDVYFKYEKAVNATSSVVD